jgi:glycosyltransferase involved in cell wall biosynthesis
MRCPTLKELPPPPEGKTGWPWTAESQRLPDRMPDGSPWPRISIVTPSLNQGQFIEETIRSVLLQGYPDLEYILMDGGSKDDSLSIIKKYHKWLAYWESKADRGQAHAINKGFQKSSGNIVAWINSDDFYVRAALADLSSLFSRFPLIKSFYGDLLEVNEASALVQEIKSHDSFDLMTLFGWMRCPQPACFWKRSVFSEIGYLNEEMHFVFDLEFWIRVGLQFHSLHIAKPLANLRLHKNTKTSTQTLSFDIESGEMYRRFCEAHGVPASLKKKKKDILRLYNQRIGNHLRKATNNSEARKFFLKAIASNPLRAKNAFLLINILDTLLDTRFSDRVSKITTRIRRATDSKIS